MDVPKGSPMIAPKLQAGDQIRIVSPSSALAVVSPEVREIASRTLAGLGLEVSFSADGEERDAFNSTSIETRIRELHAAFADPQVKGILTSLGGYNCNQLLQYLDYDLIRANPKVFCGYSDITALSAAIYAKTRLVTYSGPHFSSFGMERGLEYTLDFFERGLMRSDPIEVSSSREWSDDAWYRDQHSRSFEKNEGYRVLNPGQAEGVLLGGNLCTLNLLQGTGFMPSLAGSILFLEDDAESKPPHFDRDLQSLIHLPDFSGVRGLVIGRFQRESGMSPELLAGIVAGKKELARLPVVAGADFGHTSPQFTFPIGGRGKLIAEAHTAHLIISEH